MSSFNLETCARPNILSLKPYSDARHQFRIGGTKLFLDANENAFGPAIPPITPNGATSTQGSDTPEARRLNRYPDPLQRELKQLLCDLRMGYDTSQATITTDNVHIGAGANEVIDTVMRCFGVPGKDILITCPPSYAIYSTRAHVNDIGVLEVPLKQAPSFELDTESISSALSREPNIKMVCLVSPNNPTGTVIRQEDIESILRHPTWNGVVVLDEVYIDYSQAKSLAGDVNKWPNLVVLQTLSKAFGLAGIRVGAAYAATPIVRLLNNLSGTYNISEPSSIYARQALSSGVGLMLENIQLMQTQRNRLLSELPKLPGVGSLRGGTESNFLLFEILDPYGHSDNRTARRVCDIMAEKSDVVVRFRGSDHGCFGCVRITVGTQSEMTRFLVAIKEALVEVHAALLAESVN